MEDSSPQVSHSMTISGSDEGISRASGRVKFMEFKELSLAEEGSTRERVATMIAGSEDSIILRLQSRD